MPDIKDSVGLGALNKVHDVALVQALLMVVKNVKGHAYLGSYDGSYGDATRRAIEAFQKDNGLVAAVAKVVAPPAKAASIAPSPPSVKSGSMAPSPPSTGSPVSVGAPPSVKAPPATVVVTEKAGFMAAGGVTAKLLSSLAAKTNLKDVRIIADTKIVFFPASPTDAKNAVASIRGNGGLEPKFRENVAKLAEGMYDAHKIALSLTSSGALRTFQKQYELATTKNAKTGNFATGAGPGESNHNFGMAVDIGFNGFKWVDSNGISKTSDWWLNKMPSQKSSSLWKARNALAPTYSLFETTFKGDLIHLQNFDDANISTARSLAKLLNAVGKMKWAVTGQVYSSDLGLGKGLVAVGKSEEVWGLKSSITAKEVEGLQKAAGVTVDGSAATVAKFKAALKADFQLAEANRFKWAPVP